MSSSALTFCTSYRYVLGIADWSAAGAGGNFGVETGTAAQQDSMPVTPFGATVSPPAEADTIAEGSLTCHAYDFGYDNPQFSDRILHIMREGFSDCSEAADVATKGQAGAPLLTMHVNSLTLAANSGVLR